MGHLWYTTWSTLQPSRLTKTLELNGVTWEVPEKWCLGSGSLPYLGINGHCDTAFLGLLGAGINKPAKALHF